MIATAVAPLAAQSPPLIAPGARVRLTLITQERIAGTYLGRSADSVIVVARAQHGTVVWRIAIERICRAEASTGRQHRYGEPMLIGVTVGAACGALAYAGESGTSTREAVAFGLGSGTLTGLVVGAIIAAIGREAWSPGALDVAPPVVTAGPARFGFGFHLSLRI